VLAADLTCEKSLIDFQVGKKPRQNTCVGRDDVTALEEDDISPDERRSGRRVSRRLELY
jgi:hypothetical protein